MTNSNYIIGFYGAGPDDLCGNLWFKDLVTSFGESRQSPTRLYAQSKAAAVLRDLALSLDANKTGTITEKEIDGLSLTLMGYSWGGIAAVYLSHILSQPRKVVIGGTFRNPKIIHLTVPIPVSLLFTVDPVRLLKFPKTVPATVSSFANYYQTNGGDSIFRPTSNGSGEQRMGNWASRLMKGCPLDSKAQKSIQIDVAKGDIKRSGQPFARSQHLAEYCLEGRETGHDAMPWLVSTLF